jgi:hypothetical protein
VLYICRMMSEILYPTDTYDTVFGCYLQNWHRTVGIRFLHAQTFLFNCDLFWCIIISCMTHRVLKLKFLVSFRSPYLFCLPTVGVEVVYLHLITLKHTSQSAELLWTRDQPVAETSTWQRKLSQEIKHPCLRWDSNPRSQQALGRRSTP